MELIITSICILAIVAGFWLGSFRRKLFLAVLLPMITAHIIMQGARWQMSMVYLFILIELIGFVRNISKKKEKQEEKQVKKVRIFPSILLILGLLITVGLLFVFPYNKMDALDGEYKVGTFSMDIVDEERAELYGETKGDARKIRVQLWYPTDDIENLEKAKWLNDGVAVAKGLPDFVGAPGFTLAYMARIDSNSYLYAPLSEQLHSYPLIVISHGWTGFRNLHTDLAERLASSGYIVACVDHTYGSLATVFNDGTVAKLDLNALPDADSVDNFEEYSNALVTTYAEDVRLTIDVLEELNADTVSLKTFINEEDVNELEHKEIFETMFVNHIACDRIGVLGHSTGGGGVVQLAMTDERIDAVFGFDPWIEPIEESLIKKGLSTPSLFISSEQWEGGSNSITLKLLAEQEETVTDMYQLNGTYHQDFTMMYMFEPVTQIIGFSGELDSERSREIQQDFVQQFFDHWLVGEAYEVSDLDKKYEEIIVNELK